MAITRKEVSARDGDNSQPNLPYPTSPDSPAPAFTDFRSDNDAAGRRISSQPTLVPNPASNSQTSIPSVSDISEGWVDGDPKAHEDLPPPQLSTAVRDLGRQPDVPSVLKVGGGQRLTPKSSSESYQKVDASSPVPASTIPPSLLVQPPAPERSTNPFHRSQSSEGLPPSNTSNQAQSEAGIWTDLAVERSTPADQFTKASSREHSEQSHNSHDEDVMRPKPLNVSSPKRTATPLNPFADTYIQEIESSPWAGTGAPADVSSDPYDNLHVLEQKTSRISLNEDEAPKYAVSAAEANSAFASPFTHPPQSTEKLMQEPKAPLQPQPYEEKEYSPEPHEPVRGNILTDASTSLQIEGDLKSEVFEPAQFPSIEPASSVDPKQISKQGPVVPAAGALEKRNETYQIRLIRWLDSSSSGEVRTTPIMVQNANGPCPLLALVNALTLSTPPQLNTPLVETLRVRENVTLGLLLDAVFDELMSGRRGNTAQELPDVSELYAFLVNLHTGLNVNPQFTPKTGTLIEGILPQSAIQESRKPGGFEDTREMKLYATFSIPLVHGWLPAKAHPAYSALQRSAHNYDDAQNLLFREEELEDKLQNQGLTLGEQQLLEDIATIKYFLSSSATQLTGYGLDTIIDYLVPGSIAILFRNDHFSTLYKHPGTGELLTLVTDAGFAGHEEVVWESLVDISGEGAQFYSGDFRPVGHHQAQPSSSDNSGWTTVPARNNHNRSSNPPDHPPHSANRQVSESQEEEYNLPSPHNIVQEDEDLALAMQLQEEEEELQRRAAAVRRQEEERASQAFIAQEQQSRRTSQPPVPSPNNTGRRASRGNHRSSTSNNQNLPSLPRRPGQPGNPNDPEAGDEAPPPSYEQASKTRPYHGPANQPAYDNPNNPLTQTQSAYSHRQSLAGRAGRRASSNAGSTAAGPPGQGGQQGEAGKKDKDCIVM